MRCNGEHLFGLAELENVENWDIARRSGTADGVKWDSFTYIFSYTNTRNKDNYKQL